jgi:hypothetical protein
VGTGSAVLGTGSAAGGATFAVAGIGLDSVVFALVDFEGSTSAGFETDFASSGFSAESSAPAGFDSAESVSADRAASFDFDFPPRALSSPDFAFGAAFSSSGFEESALVFLFSLLTNQSSELC